LNELTIDLVHVTLDPDHHDLQTVDLIERGLHGRVLLLQVWKMLEQTCLRVTLDHLEQVFELVESD
jgi:hypothetical protein